MEDKLWITIGSIDYEGGTVQGIYSTYAKAEAAKVRMLAYGHLDDSWIDHITIDKDEEISI
jgi:hypothetical protein